MSLVHAVPLRRASWPSFTLSQYYCLLLALFLLATMTALNPFATRRAFTSIAETGGGDGLRQSIYLTVFVLAVIPILFKAPLRLVSALPLTMAALLAWCALTLAWSPVPDIGFRRLALTVVVALTALLITANIDLRQGLRTIGYVLFALVAASLVTGVMASDIGIHQPGDAEPTTIGDWRGVFYHKNILGGIAGIATLFWLGFFSMQPKRRWRAGFVLVVCCTGLVLSGSKTCMILTAVSAIGLYLASRVTTARSGQVLIVSVLVLASAVGLIGLLPLSGVLGALFDQPELFNGRGLIWQLTLQLFADHPIGGVGYQSIFQVGPQSAMGGMDNSVFIQTLSHAHNAYLEIAASTGAVGLTLLVCAIVAAPLLALSRLSPADAKYRPLIAALMLFVLLHGLLEAGLLDRDRPSWVILLCLIGLMRRANRRRRPPVLASSP